MNEQYINLLDMFDGGGAGRSGDRFEGGGLLSALGNAMMRPAGYQNRMLDNKNSTGRAVMNAVQGITARKPDGSVRPQARPYSPQNLPVDVDMAPAMQDANRELIGLDPDGLDFATFLQDLRTKQQEYGLPSLTIADAEIMFEEYKRRRIAQDIGLSHIPKQVTPQSPNPLRPPSMPMPGY